MTTNQNTKQRDALVVDSAVEKISARPVTPAQAAFLRRHGTSDDELSRLNIRSAGAKIGMIIADREPEDERVVERAPTGPTDAQVELAQSIGITADVILDCDRAQLSDLIDRRLADLAKAREEARQLPATKAQIEVLVRRGLDSATAEAMSRGQASQIIARTTPRPRR